MLGGAIQEKSSDGHGSKISVMAFVSGKNGSGQRTVLVRRQEGGGSVEGRKTEEDAKGCPPQGERHEWGIEQRRGIE